MVVRYKEYERGSKNMTTKYTSKRYIDGKVRHIIVDENGKITNRNPSKEELKDLEEESYTEKRRNKPIYTNEELLEYLRQFYKEYKRIPVRRDFENNPGYPYYKTYTKRFGSWSNALKLVGLDVDSMVKNGIIETNNQKARLAELKVINHFRQHPIDLAGENCINPCDGICPNGMNYDVKSSKFYTDKMRWKFGTQNEYREEIEIYYLLGFNEDYTELKYAWRVPGEIVERDNFIVGTNSNYEFNVENMKEYDITEKFKNIINN